MCWMDGGADDRISKEATDQGASAKIVSELVQLSATTHQISDAVRCLVMHGAVHSGVVASSGNLVQDAHAGLRRVDGIVSCSLADNANEVSERLAGKEPSRTGEGDSGEVIKRW